MKRTAGIIGLFLVLGLSLQAGKIKKEGAWVGFQLAAVHHTSFAGVHFEQGIGRHLALGLEISTWLEGVTGMVLSYYLVYHFPVRSPRLDLFVGAGPALAFGFQRGGTDFRLKLQGGVRYWIAYRTAVYAKLISEIGENRLIAEKSDKSVFGGAIGVNLGF